MKSRLTPFLLLLFVVRVNSDDCDDCGLGASCEEYYNICTCNEDGFSLGPKGTYLENMCTAGGVNDCKPQDFSSSKCLMPLFIKCGFINGKNFCKCQVKHVASSNRWVLYKRWHKCETAHKFLGTKTEIQEIPLGSFRSFWITGRTTDQNNKSCIDEWSPEYTCGCKKGDISCKFILGAKCSGKPDPDCYVPPGIHCNETGLCDCDRSRRDLMWSDSSKKCVVTPGGKCGSTEDCLVGTKCIDGKCSACPGTKIMDPISGKCTLNPMDKCELDYRSDSSDSCPEGTKCIMSYDDGDGYGYGSRCRCSGGNEEFDRKLKVCAIGLGGNCKINYDGGGPLLNCKTGTVCNDTKCVCDERMGLVQGIVKTKTNNYGNIYETSESCFVLENNKCELKAFKCKQYNTTTKLECLKSKVADGQYSYICTVRKTRKRKQGFDNDGQGHNIGSFAVVGFGLAIGTIF